MFEKTQQVVLKADKSRTGFVLDIKPGMPEDTILVGIDGNRQPFFASQLEPYVEPESQTLSAERFRAYLSSMEILQPSMASLHSINAARVRFIPYQYRPVLRFIHAERPRMLIADSVGVGKTIEAGFILRELEARNDNGLENVLIICPKPLVTESKWKNEMKRFDEDFEHLNGDDLRFCINETYLDGGIWPVRKNRVIVPYSKFNKGILEGQGRNRGLKDLDPPPHFDLVIVDEAHHIRNKDTNAYKTVKFFCENADAVIFLTATPIQLGDNDLFVLLNLLRPDLIIDQWSFKHIGEPNPFINSAVSAMREQSEEWQKNALACLQQAEETDWGRQILAGKVEFIKVKEKLSQTEISHEERVKLISDVENLHTFSGIINRTRRRDIGDFTVRSPEAREIDFTPEQKILHDSLLDIQRRIFQRIHGNQNVAFMMTTIRRQAASCIYGLKPFLREMVTRHADDLFEKETDESYEDRNDYYNDIVSIQNDIDELLRRAENLDPYDPKFEALRKIVSQKQTMKNRRVMLFSCFRHTLSYLEEKLSAEGFRVGLIHGGVKDEDRIDLRVRFEKPAEDPEALDVMLFSEVGCEGLDYQFCDCMVNYDLPWNPMKIEQRIGRIDREGQESPSVVIYNIITPETVDYDIYKRCLSRIGVFEKSIGDCEAILGEITKEINSIGEDFTLSEEERRRKLDILRDNGIRDMQEKQRLEDESYDFIGLQLPKEQFAREVQGATNFYLNADSIEKLATLYIRDLSDGEKKIFLGEDDLKTLQLAQDVRNALLTDFRKLPRRRLRLDQEWERWLRGSSQYLSVTFKSDSAANKKTVLLAPFHPLVQQAARHFALKDKAHVMLEVISTDTVPGDYPFAIYQWKYLGVRDDSCLKTITESDAAAGSIDELLKHAIDCADLNSAISEESIDIIDQRHHDVWELARNEHIADIRRIVQSRRESLTASHKALLAVLNERLVNVAEEHIRRMHQGEINKAQAAYGRSLQSLEEAEQKAEIEFMPVAYGVLRIKRGENV
jgi:SNF2 family DNA or RNA helicase